MTQKQKDRVIWYACVLLLLAVGAHSQDLIARNGCFFLNDTFELYLPYGQQVLANNDFNTLSNSTFTLSQSVPSFIRTNSLGRWFSTNEVKIVYVTNSINPAMVIYTYMCELGIRLNQPYNQIGQTFIAPVADTYILTFVWSRTIATTTNDNNNVDPNIQPAVSLNSEVKYSFITSSINLNNEYIVLKMAAGTNTIMFTEQSQNARFGFLFDRVSLRRAYSCKSIVSNSEGIQMDAIFATSTQSTANTASLAANLATTLTTSSYRLRWNSAINVVRSNVFNTAWFASAPRWMAYLSSQSNYFFTVPVYVLPGGINVNTLYEFTFEYMSLNPATLPSALAFSCTPNLRLFWNNLQLGRGWVNSGETGRIIEGQTFFEVFTTTLGITSVNRALQFVGCGVAFGNMKLYTTVDQRRLVLDTTNLIRNGAFTDPQLIATKPWLKFVDNIPSWIRFAQPISLINAHLLVPQWGTTQVCCLERGAILRYNLDNVVPNVFYLFGFQWSTLFSARNDLFLRVSWNSLVLRLLGGRLDFQINNDYPDEAYVFRQLVKSSVAGQANLVQFSCPLISNSPVLNMLITLKNVIVRRAYLESSPSDTPPATSSSDPFVVDGPPTIVIDRTQNIILSGQFVNPVAGLNQGYSVLVQSGKIDSWEATRVLVVFAPQFNREMDSFQAVIIQSSLDLVVSLTQTLTVTVNRFYVLSFLWSCVSAFEAYSGFTIKFNGQPLVVLQSVDRLMRRENYYVTFNRPTVLLQLTGESTRARSDGRILLTGISLSPVTSGLP